MESKRVKRIGNSAAFYIPAAILLVIVLAAFGTSVFLKIIVVEVNGSSRYSDADIVRVSGIKAGSNILRFNGDEAAGKIQSAMPYIEEARVQFILPDRVLIEVKESSVLAAIDFYNGVAIVNTKGKIIDYVDLALDDSIRVIGFTPPDLSVGYQLRANPEDETKLRHLLEVLLAIEETGVHEGITFIDITNISRVIVGYTEKYTLIIGAANEAMGKFTVLQERIQKIETDNNYNPVSRYRIDTTDPSVGWVCTPELP